jgi:hypothetical protein
MEKRRYRTKQILTLEERLLKAAEDLRTRAGELEPGTAQEALLAKARQFEAQVSINELFVPPPSRERNSIEP